MPRYKTYKKEELTVAGQTIEVHRKNVKNLNLRIYPAEQRVRVSVPRRTPNKIIRGFITDKLPWIKEHLSRKTTHSPKKQFNFTSGESHWVWGASYTLKLEEKESKPSVRLSKHDLILSVRPGSDLDKRSSVLKEWYRAQLKEKIPKLIEKWEPVMKVSVNEFGVKDMKTRWGTCNIRAKRIWLNLELAKKRPELLEYVVVHEMTHLHERLHNKRFYALMTTFLPNWKALQNELNGRGRSSKNTC